MLACVKRAVIRLPGDVVDRLDQLAEELSAAAPGQRFSRSSVVRVLLVRGLRAIEADGGVLHAGVAGEPARRGRKAK